MDNKLTDTEIKKALEKQLDKVIRLQDGFLLDGHQTTELETLITNTLDLINRLQSENTELLGKIKKLQDEYRWLDQESDILAADVNALNHFLETAKAEAYKECIENAKEELYEWVGADNSIPYTRIKKVLNNLLKELGVDGKEGET